MTIHRYHIQPLAWQRGPYVLRAERRTLTAHVALDCDPDDPPEPPETPDPAPPDDPEPIPVPDVAPVPPPDDDELGLDELMYPGEVQLIGLDASHLDIRTHKGRWGYIVPSAVVESWKLNVDIWEAHLDKTLATKCTLHRTTYRFAMAPSHPLYNRLKAYVIRRGGDVVEVQ
jgi:hypothetical protein